MAVGARKGFGVFLLMLGAVCFAAVVPIMEQMVSTSWVQKQNLTSSMVIMGGVVILGLIFIIYGLFLYRGPRRK